MRTSWRDAVNDIDGNCRYQLKHADDHRRFISDFGKCSDLWMQGLISVFYNKERNTKIVIRFLMSYIKKHDFKVFGWYRIVLGILVLAYFYLIK